MKEGGKTINSMDMAKKFGIMEQKPILVCSMREKRMERASLCGMMEVFTREILCKVCFMDLVHIISRKVKKPTLDNSLTAS